MNILSSAVLTALLLALSFPGASAEPGTGGPYEGLSGEYEGMMDGSLRGVCLNSEGTVHRVKLKVIVKDDGKLLATCEDCPAFHPEMRTSPDILGSVDNTLHVVGKQACSYPSLNHKEIRGAIQWKGKIMRTKNDLRLEMRAQVRVSESTSSFCIIDGTIKASKPL